MEKREKGTVSSKVPVAYHQKRVIEYFADRFHYREEAWWREWIEAGKVRVDGVVVGVDTLLEKGRMVVCVVPPFERPEANFDYQIIYEDQSVVGVNKPANLRVHGKGRYIFSNLLYHLEQEYQPPFGTLFLANRLDADTSGVVLLCKDRESVKKVQKQFEARSVEKKYIAVVRGVVATDEGEIRLPIGRLESVGGIKYGTEGGAKMQESVSSYLVKRRFSNHTIVHLTPHSGRTHQLRVHMAALGHPIEGDARYCLSDAAYERYEGNWEEAGFLLGRQALHCLQMGIIHPQTGEKIELTAPLAIDIEALISQLL